MSIDICFVLSWANDPAKRPTFTEIVDDLVTIAKELAPEILNSNKKNKKKKKKRTKKQQKKEKKKKTHKKKKSHKKEESSEEEEEEEKKKRRNDLKNADLSPFGVGLTFN